MADANEVLPWVFMSLLLGAFLAWFFMSQQQATVFSSPVAGVPNLVVQRDTSGRIVAIQGV